MTSTLSCPAARRRIFFVQGSGIGIAPDEIAHVFERHYQAPSSGPVRKLGSGLGLSICKSIVELSRGRIWATSRRGRGTTMMFSLPVATGDGLPE
ncbi:MAG: ATP-binding protein [Labilithrix sp.]